MPSPIEIAEAYLAQNVREETGHNDGPMVLHFLVGGDARIDRDRRAKEAGQNWCAAFVLTCFLEAGEPLPGNFWANRAVRHLETELSLLGAEVPVEEMERGDVVTWERIDPARPDRPMGHVGIVRLVGSTTFWSIEGNVGNALRAVRHRKDDPKIRHVFRWPAPDPLPFPGVPQRGQA